MVSPPEPAFTAATASRSEQLPIETQPPALLVSAVVLTGYVVALAIDAPPSASGTDIASAMSPRCVRPLHIPASFRSYEYRVGLYPGTTGGETTPRQGGAQARVVARSARSGDRQGAYGLIVPYDRRAGAAAA